MRVAGSFTPELRRFYYGRFYDEDLKLDFSDVLIVPTSGARLDKRGKPSLYNHENQEDIESRKDVVLISKFFPFADKKKANDILDDIYVTGSEHNVSADFNINADNYQVVSDDSSFKAIPIIAANMDGVGTVEMHNQLSKNLMMTALNKSIPDEELDKIQDPSLAFLTIGINYDELERVKNFKDKFLKICIDTPNAYLPKVLHFVRKVREICGPKHFIMVGNVVTPETAINLYHAGANCVKVGIGPGSVCTTRIKTGVGFPQLSAVMEIAKEAERMNSLYDRRFFVCSDGGCTTPGDIAKALIAGADFVMVGGMLAGHDEGGGEIVSKYIQSNEVMPHPEGHGWVPVIDEKKYVKFYGMSSKAANDKHNGGLKGYRSAEGKEVLVKYKGPVQNTVDDILGGLRSTCTYVGTKHLMKMPRFGQFVLVNNQVNTVFGNE